MLHRDFTVFRTEQNFDTILTTLLDARLVAVLSVQKFGTEVGCSSKPCEGM
jgi:hypothetical protein